MAITLAQAKIGMADKVDQNVIDEFRRSSLLLEKLTFDDTVSPGTGGSTLVYGYTQLKTPATAEFREINSEYTGNEAERDKKSVELKVFGGKFSIDRVIARTSGAIDEVNFQLQEKIKATTNTFHNAVINGDSSVKGFDGLDVMLADSSTELNKDTANVIDLSTATALNDNYMLVLDMLDELLASVDGTPDMIMGNTKMITKIAACARRAGYFSHAEDALGKRWGAYNNIPLVDLENYFDGEKTSPVVPIVTRGEISGLTDLYTVRLGLDGFHAASPAGGKLINTTLPDFTTAGAVKDGDVEMVAATVLKNTRAAGVLRNFKVQ